MHGTGCSSAERRWRRSGLTHRAFALALSWTFTATSVWSPAFVGAAPLPASARALAGGLEATGAGVGDAAADSASDVSAPATAPPCDATLWGPRRFTRTSGAPNVYDETVFVPDWILSPYALTVLNGEPDGRRRVSSAWLSVDGARDRRPRRLLAAGPGCPA